ncbi:MAG: zinc finger protein [Terracidiphilus sp.]|nr:zinc finger protein [Terracidiphilus sp.]
MSARATATMPAVLSYYALCKTVGIIALSLPFALAGGTILLAQMGPAHRLPQPLLQRSISDYYYTPLGNVLVGSLFAIATILICSRGYELADEIAGLIAGFATLGVAVFPQVNPRGFYTETQVRVGFVHTAFAAAMFLALAYFCLVLFRRSTPGVRPTKRKRQRNRLYAVCGVVIMLCNIVMAAQTIPVVFWRMDPYRPLLVSEALALAAFGVAWLTKGKGLLKDR